MAGDRRRRIVHLLSWEDGAPTQRLCRVCAEVTGTSGAGITLMAGDGPETLVCTSNEVSARLEELQFTVGQGPSVDAYNQEGPVIEPDLASPITPRWLGLAPPAIKAGVRAVFGFPLQVGAIRFGALHLYRDQPGPLSEDQHARALVVADLAAETLLLLQANAPPGALAIELNAATNTGSAVHQAAGMISAQLDVSVAQALIRLRAYAFGNDRALLEVATAVVDRRLRFGDDLRRRDAASRKCGPWSSFARMEALLFSDDDHVSAHP